MLRNLLILFSFLSCFGYALPASAAHEIAYMTEQDFLGDVPLVLGASRLPQRLQDAPSATIVIDRQTIEASGFNNVADVLRLVPGMYVGYFKGHAPSVALHGLTGEYSGRMQVLVDGRSVYNSLIGSVEWNDIPLLIEDIERIEVVRGPNSASFGANAFMGVINITTRDPAKIKSSVAGITLGDNGQRRASARLAGHAAAWDYRLSAGYRADDGFDKVNDSQRQKILDLRASYTPNGSDSWQFGAGHNTSSRGKGYVDTLLDQPHPEFNTASYASANWARSLGPDREISARLYHGSNDIESSVTSLPLAALGNQRFTISGVVDMQRTDFEAQYRFTPTPDWRVVAGGGLRRDSARSEIYLGTGKREINDTQRLFAHGEWHANSRLNVNLGAMLEDTSYTGREFSPRIALNYRLTPDHALRTSVSRATRTPTIYEEKADYHINLGPVRIQQNLAVGGLRSEHIASTELGYVGNFSSTGMTLDLRLYRDRLSDLVGAIRIASPPGSINPGTISATNVNDATIRGYETSLRYVPVKSTDILLGYANTRISSNDPELERTMPINTLSLLARHAWTDHLNTSLGYYQTSKVDGLSEGDPVPLARRLEARAAYRFGPLSTLDRGGEIALVMQNLLGKYADFKLDNVADRRVYVSLDWQW